MQGKCVIVSIESQEEGWWTVGRIIAVSVGASVGGCCCCCGLAAGESESLKLLVVSHGSRRLCRLQVTCCLPSPFLDRPHVLPAIYFMLSSIKRPPAPAAAGVEASSSLGTADLGTVNISAQPPAGIVSLSCRLCCRSQSCRYLRPSFPRWLPSDGRDIPHGILPLGLFLSSPS